MPKTCPWQCKYMALAAAPKSVLDWSDWVVYRVLASVLAFPSRRPDATHGQTMKRISVRNLFSG